MTRKPDTAAPAEPVASLNGHGPDKAIGADTARVTRDEQLISVIMPALNEAASVEQTIRSVPVEAFSRLGFRTEVIVVDNGSEDGTGDLARRAGARVLVEERRGYGYAYRRGFRESTGGIICTMDADLTYPSEMLPKLISKLLQNDLQFISTDRFAQMHNGVMSRRNKMGNAILSGITRTLFDHPFRDSQSGMWVFRGDLLDRMDLRAGGMALSQEIKIEAAYRLKARCAEVPIKYGYRVGESKLRVWRDGVGNLIHLARRRFS